MNHGAMKIAAIVIGSIIGVVVMALGFRLVQTTFSRAGDEAPRDVVVSEITQNSGKISWSTGQENQGVVEYGTSPTALNFFAPEAAPTLTHSVDLTLLSPGTTYYFQIRVADKKHDNGGVPWVFTTKSADKSVAPTASETQPTPISTVEVPIEEEPTPTTAAATASCTETDCAAIKEKIGNGCTTQDYFKCLQTTPAP